MAKTSVKGLGKFDTDLILQVYNSLSPEQRKDLHSQISEKVGLPNILNELASKTSAVILEKELLSPDATREKVQSLFYTSISPETEKKYKAILNLKEDAVLTPQQILRASLLSNLPNYKFDINGIQIGNPLELGKSLISDPLADELYNNVAKPAEETLSSEVKKKVLVYIVSAGFAGLALGYLVGKKVK